MHETLEPEEQQRSRNWGGARAGAGRPVTKPVHDPRVAMMAGAINSDYAKDLPSLAACRRSPFGRFILRYRTRLADPISRMGAMKVADGVPDATQQQLLRPGTEVVPLADAATSP